MAIAVGKTKEVTSCGCGPFKTIVRNMLWHPQGQFIRLSFSSWPGEGASRQEKDLGQFRGYLQ